MTASTSLAAQAVAAGPPTLAPPSFEGNNWLYVLNLFVFFAGTSLYTMFFLKLANDHLLCAVSPFVVPAGRPWWSRDLIATRVRLPRPDRPWARAAIEWIEPRLVSLLAALMRYLGPARKPGSDNWKSPIMLLRRVFILIALGFALRCFSEMQSLWRWYPLDPVGTGRGMALKRLLDPVALMTGSSGMAIFFLGLPGLEWQLRKEPFPVNMWTSLPLLKRPAGVVLCCFVSALAVVLFR